MSGVLALAQFSIDVDEVGKGRVEINGEDVSGRIVAWQVSGGAPNYTTMIVRQPPGAAKIEGQGVVQVVVDIDDEEQAAMIHSWLAGLDPQKLEEQVLEVFGSHDAPATNAEAWLLVLGRMADSS